LIKNRHAYLLKTPNKGPAGSRRSLQTQKELFKHETLLFFFLFLGDIFGLPGPGSRSADPFESEYNPVPDPRDWFEVSNF
jgi:hypothetical protein